MKRTALVLSTVVTAGAFAPLAEAASLKQFAGKADTICSSANKKIGALKEPKTADALVKYLKQTIALAKPAQAKLEALELPDTKKATAKKAVTLSAKDQTIVKSYLKALESGQSVAAATKTFQKTADANTKIEDAAWKSVGATKCVSS